MSTREIEVVRIPYARAGGRTLELKITRPAGPGPFPAMLDLHGGAWTHFDHEVDFVWCEALARRGFAMASVEFRTGPEDPWPAFHEDARAAARFVRQHATALRVDARALGAIGGSTGGHMAVLLGLVPDGPSSVALDTPRAASAAIDWAVGLYPILDVPGRYAMAKGARFDPVTTALGRAIVGRLRARAIASGASPAVPPKLPSPVARLRRLAEARARGGLGARAGDALQIALWAAGKVPLLKAIEYPGLVAAHDGVFPTLDAMREASPLHVVREGRAQRRPPILVVQGRDDPNMTDEMTHGFARAYRDAGGSIDVAMLPRHGHGFANVPSAKSEAMCDRVAGWCRAIAAHTHAREEIAATVS